MTGVFINTQDHDYSGDCVDIFVWHNIRSSPWQYSNVKSQKCPTSRSSGSDITHMRSNKFRPERISSSARPLFWCMSDSETVVLVDLPFNITAMFQWFSFNNQHKTPANTIKTSFCVEKRNICKHDHLRISFSRPGRERECLNFWPTVPPREVVTAASKHRGITPSRARLLRTSLSSCEGC